MSQQFSPVISENPIKISLNNYTKGTSSSYDGVRVQASGAGFAVDQIIDTGVNFAQDMAFALAACRAQVAAAGVTGSTIEYDSSIDDYINDVLAGN